jgi:hypothetical protein
MPTAERLDAAWLKELVLDAGAARCLCIGIVR